MNDATITRDAAMIAEEINGIKEHVRSTFIKSSIEIGRKLHEAKALVPYGEWGKWLEVNVDYSESTAQNLMRIADEYGRKESQALADISYTQAVALLRLPAEEREQFVREHDMQSISTRELQEEIKRLNEEREKLQLTIDEMLGLAPQAESGRLPSAEGSRENAITMVEESELEAARDAERTAREAAEEAQGRARDLEKALTEARAQVAEAEKRRQSDLRSEQAKTGAADKEKEKAVSERNEARKLAVAMELQIKRMEEELEAARKQVRTVQVLPEQVEAELNRLRAQASRSSAESDMRAAFDGFVAAFERLMSKLGDAMEADAETAMKFRAAFRKTTLQMAERMTQA